TYTWDRSEWPYLEEWLYGTQIHVHLMIKYTDDEGETRYLGKFDTGLVDKVRPPVITHKMTATEPYTTGTSIYDGMTIIADLYQATYLAESQEVTIAADGTWSMTAPTGWAVGYGDLVKYRVRWTDGQTTLYSKEVHNTLTDGFFPATPTIGDIYINDEEVPITWQEVKTLPTGWTYVSASVQGRTFTKDGVVKHSINQAFDPSSGSATITVTDCPRYARGDYVNVRVCVTYTDGTNNYTTGSYMSIRNIDEVKIPTITHYMTTTEPYTAGTCNSYNYYVKAEYFQDGSKKETTNVAVDSDGNWTMNPPTTVTPTVGDVITYQALWLDTTTGDILASSTIRETITE
ncbi:MAG TPA: hypothetical protein O0X14_02125, partial [Methanocorpusculum sp.]|nr:hypothetical protein [Methanocorpusculum sp.]